MKKSWILICSLLSLTSAFSELKLPSLIGDNMVLQQQSAPLVWGRAGAGTTVTIITSWNKKVYRLKADQQGEWRSGIVTPAAGGPYEIVFSQGAGKQVVRNVMIGEVWVCSGQSNMEMPMRGFKNQPVLNSNDILLEAQDNQLRLFKVASANSKTPQTDCKGSWQLSDPGTAREFSAVAYQFGRMLQERLKVPVGLILSCVGGTMIESWMSRPCLSRFPEAKWPPEADTTKQPYKAGSALFNGMIAPLVGYGIKGFIWYQGESNRHEPQTYEKLFPAMVADWRQCWNAGYTLPFYYAQIAPYNSKDAGRSGPRLREAQLNSQDIIPDAGMAVTMDLGLENYIHFTNKTAVSKRLLYWTLAKAYHQAGIAYKSPVYKNMFIKGDTAILSFSQADNGLTSYAKDMVTFEIAGEDKVFYTAKAVINANATLSVTSTAVKVPVAVRYGFKEWVVGDLYSTEGLPLSSFRTDNWEK